MVYISLAKLFIILVLILDSKVKRETGIKRKTKQKYPIPMNKTVVDRFRHCIQFLEIYYFVLSVFEINYFEFEP